MSYFIRLANVCFASFFVINLALELLVLCVSPYVIRLAERMRPAAGARLLLAMRLLPMLLTSVAIAAWCVPSYLRYEQDASESIALTCTLLALCGVVILGASAARLAWGLSASARMLKRADEPAMEHMMFALVGFLRPRVIVSRRIHEALSSPQMEAALLHEAAHSNALDNLKRLAMLAAPRPLGRLHRVESEWSRLAEFAADDAAIAGEPRRAIALAEALVCVARLSGRLEGSAVISSLVARKDELGERVGRLLALKPADARSLSRSRAVSAAAVAGFAGSVLLLAMHQGELLFLAHSAMERLAH
jgi:hypothetical protein